MNCGQIITLFITTKFAFLDDEEHEWIVRTCRKSWDEFVGYDSVNMMNKEEEPRL